MTFSSALSVTLSLVVTTTLLKTCSCEELKLLILHNNDMHARFEETSVLSDTCRKFDKNSECYGGFARISHVVKEARKESENSDRKVLFLNAGDTYAGTAWYGVHRWKIVADFLNLLNPDAMSLGNHEFDNGISDLLPLVERTKFPILAANLDFSNEPTLQSSRITKSVILNVTGHQIGIIGYLTPETVHIAVTENVIFKDEVASIREESERLYSLGVKIIIALGHSGYKMDQIIAREVPLVDVVIGGHTNTFLWNGKPPSTEKPVDVYPKVVQQSSGKKVPVVQAYAFTKYMGRLNLTFNDDGDLVDFHGQPLLLDSSIPQDKDALDLLETFRPEVELLNRQIVGKSAVYLDGNNKHCRTKECNFGNFITDAFVAWRSSEYRGKFWTDAPIAVMNGGNIRNSINATAFGGNITKGELLGCLPFNVRLVVVKLFGSDLIKMLETSVRGNGETSRGEFLQMSGLHVVYDLSKPTGSRVVSAEARCGSCNVPRYSPVKSNETYGIVTTTFLVGGGDGYYILKNRAFDKEVADLDDLDVVSWHTTKKSTIFPEVQGRIRFVEDLNEGRSASRINLPIGILSLLAIFTLGFTR